MSHVLYLLGLLFGVAGLLTIDRRLKLAFWHDARRTAKTILPAMAIFILWDVAGIVAGVFSHGDSAFSLPFTIAPEFPIEETIFLFVLTYTALLLYLGTRKLWPRI